MKTCSKDGKVKSEESSTLPALLYSGILGCITSICYLYNPKSQQELLDQINEKLNEINSKILGVAVLNNQVEKVRELLSDYSEIKDKNNKYPYQYAIDNGNREILELFSHYYEERKAEIERTKGKFADKVRKWSNREYILNKAGTFIGAVCAIQGAVVFFVARSETDVLKNSIFNFVHPTFYKVYRLMFEIQNQTYNTEAELVQIKIDRKLQGCENLTNGANHSSIGDVEVMKDYLNQLKNKILEVEKGLEGIKGDIKKFNIGEEAPNVEYLSSVKDLRGFIDKNVMVLIGLSTIPAILFLEPV